MTQRWRERQGSPYTGKLSARPAGKPGLSSSKRVCDYPFPAIFSAASGKYRGAPVCVFFRHAESIWSDGVQSQNQNQSQNPKPTPGRDRAASRRSAPHRVKERAGRIAPLSHRPQMSSGRLFLDRVGRHQSPSPLHRHGQINMHFPRAEEKDDISTLPGRRHFYFALTICLACLDFQHCC